MADTGIPQSQQPHLHPLPVPPPFQEVPLENPNRATIDELRTILISGLPGDVKEIELLNLLRCLPGYEASQLDSKTEPPMGFALFTTSQFAIAAKDALQGVVFDHESKPVLHTEMAKKNLFMKRGVVADPNSVDQSKRLRTGSDYTHTGYPSPAPFQPPPPPVSVHQGYMPPPPSQYDPHGAYPVPPPVPMPIPAPLPAPSGYAPVQVSHLHVTSKPRRTISIPRKAPALPGQLEEEEEWLKSIRADLAKTRLEYERSKKERELTRDSRVRTLYEMVKMMDQEEKLARDLQ